MRQIEKQYFIDHTIKCNSIKPRKYFKIRFCQETKDKRSYMLSINIGNQGRKNLSDLIMLVCLPNPLPDLQPHKSQCHVS